MWHKKIIMRWESGYIRGYEVGSRDMSQFVREMIIKNLIADAVISTNLSVEMLERVVRIVEES